VLAGVSTRPDLAVAGSSVHLAGPGNTAWVVGEGVDRDYNDTGLLPYALASIAGIVFEDPEGDGLKGSTAIGLFNNLANILVLLLANKIVKKATDTGLF